MTEILDRELAEKFLDGLRCSRGVQCADSSLEHLRRARHIGLAKLIECLAAEEACTFSFGMGQSPLLCRRPVHMHLCRRLAPQSAAHDVLAGEGAAAQGHSEGAAGANAIFAPVNQGGIP